MSNPVVTRIRKNRGQSAATQSFTNGTPLNWVVNIERPLRGLSVLVQGALTTSGGSVNPAATLDATLKMLGTLQVTLSTDKGTFDLVPAGTRIDMYYNAVKAIYRSMLGNVGFGQMWPQNVANGNPGYFGVTGLAAASPEPFAVTLPIPFQFMGGESAEQDFAALAPENGDQTLTVTITPPDLTANAALAGNYTAPFPNSDRVYALTGLAGSGNAQAELILHQVEKFVPGVGFGKWLPRFESKTLSIATAGAGAAIQSGLQIQNWERGGLWHAAFLFPQLQVAASYVVSNDNRIDIPQSLQSTDSQAHLRDFLIYAGTEVIYENNLLEEIAQQHPFPDYVDFGSSERETQRRPNIPIVLNFTEGRSAFSLWDFAPFIATNQQINFEFNNVQSVNSANNMQLDAMVLRYQPRMR